MVWRVRAKPTVEVPVQLAGVIVADEHEVTVLEVTVLAVRGSAHAAYTIVGGLQW